MDENTNRNQKMKGLAIVLIMALFHFALSALIVPVTLKVGSAVSVEQSEPSLAFKTLVVATRILHFPIISQSWYSRHWFPGGWIYIPIFFNSLLWATGIFSLHYIYKRIKKKKTKGTKPADSTSGQGQNACDDP
jgi:hypothetical protein